MTTHDEIPEELVPVTMYERLLLAGKVREAAWNRPDLRNIPRVLVPDNSSEIIADTRGDR